MRMSGAASLVLVLAACGEARDADGPAAEAGPERGPHAFEVRLTLTPRAIEQLAATGEQVTVAGLYWGEPSEAGGARADAMGRINLGRDDINVQPANRAVLVPGAAIDADALAREIAGEPQVLVTVHTARLAHEDNLILCGFYEGPVTMAQKQPVEIRCDLIVDQNGEPIVPD